MGEAVALVTWDGALSFSNVCIGMVYVMVYVYMLERSRETEENFDNIA